MGKATPSSRARAKLLRNVRIVVLTSELELAEKPDRRGDHVLAKLR